MDSATRMRRREESRRRVQRQRRIAAVLALLIGLGALTGVVLAVTGGGSGGAGGDGKSEAKAKPPPPPELPRGGRSIFPQFRVVAFYGAPQDEELGELGIGSPAKVTAKLERQAKPYLRGKRPILPAFELISTIASGAPGPDNRYSYRQPHKVIDRYLKAAREAKALLILDIQPGYVDFMKDVRALRKYIEQPDVSIALDPEWKIPVGSIPGQVIGSTTAADVNRVTRYMTRIVRERKLPQKLLVVHQFTEDMIKDKQALVQTPEVALTLNVDGFGDRPNKISKYNAFARDQVVKDFHPGFKLFYREDTNLMKPRNVLRLRPQPELVIYE